MMRQLGILVGGSVLLWVLLALPAWLLAGADALLDCAVASGLCLVPMTATLLWCHWTMARRNAPAEQLLLAVMGGTGVRLVVVIAASIGLFLAVEALHRPAFLIWVVVFYLLTLALEIVLVVRGQNMRPEQPQP